MKVADDPQKGGKVSKGYQTELEEENRRLRSENDILKQQRDVLKKAVRIFAQSQP